MCVLVGSDRRFEAFPLLLSAFFGSRRQEVLDPVEQVALAASVAQRTAGKAYVFVPDLINSAVEHVCYRLSTLFVSVGSNIMFEASRANVEFRHAGVHAHARPPSACGASTEIGLRTFKSACEPNNVGRVMGIMSLKH